MNMHEKINDGMIVEFLKNSFVCSFATLDENGCPSLANMLYLVDDDYTFYLFSKDGTEKCKNITKNDHIALSVVNANSYQTVQIKGTAEILYDYKIISNKLDILADKFKKIHNNIDVPPFFKLDSGEIVLITIRPHWGRFIDFLQYDKDMPYKNITFIS